jgi:hypothetical protein
MYVYQNVQCNVETETQRNLSPSCIDALEQTFNLASLGVQVDIVKTRSCR